MNTTNDTNIFIVIRYVLSLTAGMLSLITLMLPLIAYGYDSQHPLQAISAIITGKIIDALIHIGFILGPLIYVADRMKYNTNAPSHVKALSTTIAGVFIGVSMAGPLYMLGGAIRHGAKYVIMSEAQAMMVYGVLIVSAIIILIRTYDDDSVCAPLIYGIMLRLVYSANASFLLVGNINSIDIGGYVCVVVISIYMVEVFTDICTICSIKYKTPKPIHLTTLPP